MSGEIERSGKYLRQMDFANPDKFRYTVTIIGAGAVGSPTVIALAKMGVKRIKLLDFDVIEEHNVANQMCLEKQHLGKTKATAIAQLAMDMSAGSVVEPYVGKLEGELVNLRDSEEPVLAKDFVEGIVILAPDDMVARADTWKACKFNPKVCMVIDCRMAAEYMEIYTANPLQAKECIAYEKTLISNEDATPDPCGARGIIYTSLIAGGKIAHLVKKIQLGEEIPAEITEDISNGFVTLKTRDGKTGTNRESLSKALSDM
jgi:molybdopterin/thiamine biosynthesis adenylyltransferase